MKNNILEITRALTRRLTYPAPAWSVYTVPQRKLAYFQIPKNGCTTIKTQVLFPLLHPGRTVSNIHKQLRPEYYKRPEDLLERLSGYFLFTVVRDPVERFISLYNHSSFARSTNEHDNVMESQRFFGSVLTGYADIDTLIDQLSYDHICHDPHLRPQWLQLPENLNLFQHIGNTARMADTFSVLEKQLGMPLEVKQLYAWQAVEGGKKRPRNEQSYEKLRHLYKKDYELLKSYL